MKFLSWPKKHKWLTSLAVFALVVIGVAAYYKISLELNRRAFEQASQAIDTIYADIVKEIGPPDDHRNSKECSQSYSGPYNLVTSCGVHVDFIYSVDDKEQADDKLRKIRSIVENRPDLIRPVSMPESDIVTTPAPGNSNLNTSINYYKSNGGILCIFKYVYDSPEQTYL